MPEDTFEASSGGVHANTHLSQLIAIGLDPKITHELTLEPVFEKGSKQELRFESLSIAGVRPRFCRESLIVVLSR